MKPAFQSFGATFFRYQSHLHEPYLYIQRLWSWEILLCHAGIGSKIGQPWFPKGNESQRGPGIPLHAASSSQCSYLAATRGQPLIVTHLHESPRSWPFICIPLSRQKFNYLWTSFFFHLKSKHSNHTTQPSGVVAQSTAVILVKC